ncbi:hypothetical protein VPH35_051428 [Triticum aestivum]|uniref:Uncharacterized protein n=1 Tax=Triticum aestivum TaxID=4565 RepID=A0A077RW12_WHEAT|nr:unnamed protein product [Triticum aestivum]
MDMVARRLNPNLFGGNRLLLQENNPSKSAGIWVLSIIQARRVRAFSVPIMQGEEMRNRLKLNGMDVKPGDVPRVLEGTMSTSVAYLVGIGVARRQIGGVIWVAISGREGGRRRPLEPNQQRSGRTTARGHRRSIRFFPHDPTPPAGSAHGMGASSRGRPPAPPHEPGT